MGGDELERVWTMTKLTLQLRIRHAHFMKEDPRGFDAPFFNMSYAEASVLDPQQRGLLEGAYRTFENGQSLKIYMVRTCNRIQC